MKIIVEGIAYDTEKAVQLAGGNNGPWSHAWWGLYRTQNGAFFKIVVDHDGETLLQCRTVTDAEAQTDLEKHANHLVEQQFGPMPEPGAFRRDLRFSRRTILAAIDTMGMMNHAYLTRFILELGPDFPQHVGGETMSVARRARIMTAIGDKESPSNFSDLQRWWPTIKPASYYNNLASGALGWAAPAAVGIALAQKESDVERPIVAVIGDGSLQYSVQSLVSAAHHKLKIIDIIPCNGEYAILKEFAELEKTPNVFQRWVKERAENVAKELFVSCSVMIVVMSLVLSILSRRRCA